MDGSSDRADRTLTAIAVPASGDADLIHRARSGDAAAFEALLAPRLDGLYRAAWAIVGNESDARDATQDACVSAWRHLPRLRDLDSFDGWLAKVLVNSCRMLLRRQRRVREVAMPEGFDPEGPTTARADAFDDADLVARAFDRLDADARALLVLHHFRHEPVARIAAVLGMPVGTVKWRLHLARQALERALEGEGR
jgi:RNA polymerase sigma-70 factor (ECF subfamily)